MGVIYASVCVYMRVSFLGWGEGDIIIVGMFAMFPSPDSLPDLLLHTVELNTKPKMNYIFTFACYKLWFSILLCENPNVFRALSLQ